MNEMVDCRMSTQQVVDQSRYDKRSRGRNREWQPAKFLCEWSCQICWKQWWPKASVKELQKAFQILERRRITDYKSVNSNPAIPEEILLGAWPQRPKEPATRRAFRKSWDILDHARSWGWRGCLEPSHWQLLRYHMILLGSRCIMKHIYKRLSKGNNIQNSKSFGI